MIHDDVITMHCKQVFKSTYVMYTARLSPRYLPVVTSILRALAMNDLQLVATTKETQLEALPQKRALIIAVENRSCPEFRKLWRPHNDARNIADLLIDTYRYEAKNVVILLEDDDPVQVDSQPTYINVMKHINQLTQDAKPGDRFFFYFSGHSIQQENKTGSEEDGRDEYIVTKSGKRIQDNELRAHLVEKLPVGSHLTAVLDTCHSGSLLDLKHYRCNRVLGPKRSDSGWKALIPAFCEQTGLRQRRGAISRSDHLRTRNIPSLISIIQQEAEPEYFNDTCTPPPTYILNDMERMCESPEPVSGKFCSGSCEISKEPIKAATVVCLSSCKDSQSTSEIDDMPSMTGVLIEFCRKQSRPTFKDLMVHIIQATREVNSEILRRKKSHAGKMKGFCQSCIEAKIPIPTSHETENIKEFYRRNFKQDPQLSSDPSPLDVSNDYWDP